MAPSNPAADEVQDPAEAPSEEETTSTNDTALESDDTGFDDAEDDGQPPKADKDEEAPDKAESEALDEDDGFDDEDDTEEPKEEQSDEEAKAKADEPDPENPQPQLTAEQIKERNRQAAEARIAAKDQREAVIGSKKQEYIDAAGDDAEEQFRRTTEVELYDSRVERNTNRLTSASDRAFTDFKILNDPDPTIQRQVDRALDAFQAKHVTIDRFGNPTKVSGDLYTYLQEEAKSIEELTGKGARQQIESKATEKRKAFTPPSRKPVTKKKSDDAMVEAFDEEANRY